MADIRASIDDDDLPGELQAGATAESADELPGIETKTPHTRLSRKRTKTGCLSECWLRICSAQAEITHNLYSVSQTAN
jgi:hypothetical protein